jgi:hypothetical protein
MSILWSTKNIPLSPRTQLFKHVSNLLPPIMQDIGISLKISLFYKNRVTKDIPVRVFKSFFFFFYFLLMTLFFQNEKSLVY